MNEKLTLQYLIEALTKRHQMDPKDADAFVKAFFELIRRALERDKYIKVNVPGRRGVRELLLLPMWRCGTVSTNLSHILKLSS